MGRRSKRRPAVLVMVWGTALSKVDNAYSGVVYKGQSLDQSTLNRYLNSWNNGQGNGEILEPFFLSSSKNESVALQFRNQNLTLAKNPVIFEINSTKGVDIDDVSFYGTNFDPSTNPSHFGFPQEEVLFSSRSNFKITNIVETTETINGQSVTSYRIFMDEL